MPFRAYAVKDGDRAPDWWITTNQILFTRVGGNQETVLIGELTWVGNGHADQGLYGLFTKKVLYCSQNPTH
jgi:hypothetical protein